MDYQQQTTQTENIIIEMLEFLDSSSEDGDDLEKFAKSQAPDDLKIAHKDFNDNILPVKNEKNLNSQNNTNHMRAKKSKSSIIKELKKLKQQFPIWNTKEVAPFTDSLYYKTTSSLLDAVNDRPETDNPSPVDSNLDWHLKLETNCRRNSTSNSFIQEVQRAIYGDKTGHPPSGSAEYYQAAQNYLESLLNEKNKCGSESANLINNFNSSLYPMSQGLGNTCVIGKPNTTNASVIASPNCALTSASPASTAAYYQLCNGIHSHTRPAISNNAVNSATYGIFLGNKVTYVATTPTVPSLLYNQHSKTTTNFISNSLANAALATSPTILYSNPMLTTTTQQYLNTFFKETQFLSAGLTANSTQAAAALGSNSTTGIYERLVYAQMLQQQLYHQTQQAAAVAAMFQHKQRAAAAAAVASASNRQQTTNTNVTPNASRTSPQHFANPKTPSTGIGSLGTTNNAISCSSRQQPSNVNVAANVNRTSPQHFITSTPTVNDVTGTASNRQFTHVSSSSEYGRQQPSLENITVESISE